MGRKATTTKAPGKPRGLWFIARSASGSVTAGRCHPARARSRSAEHRQDIVTETVTGTSPNVTELEQTRPYRNGPAKPDYSAVSAGYATKIGGIPGVSNAGRPDSRSGGGAGGGVFGGGRNHQRSVRGKIDFMPSARPAEGPSSFPYLSQPPASRWQLCGPALAVSRAFACRVSQRRLSAESPARDPCNASPRAGRQNSPR
jgi:hypothetical protein